MHAFAVILALAASAMAYQVNAPSETQGFTSHGPNTVSWTKVDTDPSEFQIILTNSNTTTLPENKQLASSVEGEKGSYTFTTPEALPEGEHFRINLCRTGEPDSILAQSNEFSITDGATDGGLVRF